MNSKTNSNWKKTCITDFVKVPFNVFILREKNINAYNATGGKNQISNVHNGYKITKISTYWWAYNVHYINKKGV